MTVPEEHSVELQPERSARIMNLLLWLTCSKGQHVRLKLHVPTYRFLKVERRRKLNCECWYYNLSKWKKECCDARQLRSIRALRAKSCNGFESHFQSKRKIIIITNTTYIWNESYWIARNYYTVPLAGFHRNVTRLDRVELNMTDLLPNLTVLSLNDRFIARLDSIVVS